MTTLDDSQREAAQRVEAWLTASTASIRILTAEDLSSIGLDATWAGWTFTVEGRDLSMAVDRRFPYSLPKVFVRDDIYTLKPHIERRGRLCLVADGVGIDSEQPELIAQAMLKRAINLLAEIDQGLHDRDWIDDFGAYWRRSDGLGRQVFTLLGDGWATRRLNVWHGRSMLLVSDDESALRRWIENRFGSNQQVKLEIGLAVGLESLPTPARYPLTVADLKALCPDATSQIDELLVSDQSSVVIVIQGLMTDGDVATGGLILAPATQPGRSKATYNGFRPGKLPPPSILGCRWRLKRSSTTAVTAAASRLPASFIGLADKKVVVIGCGSLGAGSARLLVQAGVGELTLVDFDVLGFENIGRHELGAGDVGSHKASTLARRLKESFPQIVSAEAADVRWEEWLRTKGEAELLEADVILSLMGDWNSEAALADYACSKSDLCPVIFSWMERNAAATHVVATRGGQPCLRCGFDPIGQPLISVTRWSTSLPHEGCAAPTSPYGSIDLAYAQAIVAQTAVDVLLDHASPPFRRVWTTSAEMVQVNGGDWDASWVEQFGDPPPRGGFSATPWPANSSCKCQRGSL